MSDGVKKIAYSGYVPSERGVFSGLDFKQMISDALKKKEIPIKKAEDSISFNHEKVAALSQLQSLLNSFSSSLSNIKGINAGQIGTDLLQAKKVVLSSSNAEKADGFLKVTPGYNFPNENFTLEVTQLAQNRIVQTVGFSSISSSATNLSGNHDNVNLFTPGTFALNGSNITVAEGDTLQNVVNKINYYSSSTNVTAKIINPSASNFRIMLESSVVGSGSTITFNDVDNVLNNVFSPAAIQVGQNAIVKYNDNVIIEKPSNTINDFMEGLTINLYNPTTYSGQPFKVKVAVAEDVDKAIGGIEDFIAQYNALVKFITQQQGRDEDGNYYDSAKIRRDEYITNILSDIRSVAAELSFAEDSSLKIGVNYLDKVPANPSTNEPEYKGLLSLDKELMMQAMESDFKRVIKKFRFEVSGDISQLNVYKRGEDIRNGNVVLDINISRSAADIVRATYNGATFNMTFTPYDSMDLSKGGRIKGQNSTAMQGYEFGYSGLGTEVKNLQISQGVADHIFERIKEAASETSTTGRTIVENEILEIIKSNELYKNQITIHTERMQKEKDDLLMRYAEMEAKIAQYQSMMDFLTAQSDYLNKR